MRLLALTCVLIAAGYFCTTRPDPRSHIVGWAGIGFFFLGFITFPWMLFKAGTQVIINEHGIEDKRWDFGLIAWSDVVLLSIGRMSGQRFLCIEVVDEKKYLGRLPTFDKVATQATCALGFPKITIGFTGLSHSADEVLNFIREHYPTIPV